MTRKKPPKGPGGEQAAKPKAPKAKAAPKTSKKTASSKASSPATSEAKTTRAGNTGRGRRSAAKVPAPRPLEDLGSLPRSYGEDSIFLVAQDPHWLFTYWDIDIAKHPGGPCQLRVMKEDGTVEHEIEVPFETRNWYVPVREAGGGYVVEIGYRRGRSWKVLARSAPVSTPRNRLSESDRFDFATIPLHVGFQRLVETIGHSVGDGAALVPVLAALQRVAVSGERVDGLPAGLGERAILVTLLGSDFMEYLSSAGLGSGELHSAILARLQERLASGELVEFIGRLQLAGAEGSLFSGFGGALARGAWSGEFASGQWSGEISSAMLAALGEAVSSIMSSGLLAGQAGWSGEVPTSAGLAGQALASWGRGSEVTGSWQSALGGSSFNLASMEFLMSLLSGAGASWSGALAGQFEEIGSEVLSSIGGWSGFSGASWGGPLASDGLALAAAVPSLSLDAEIIVRGKTDPGGAVRIGGDLVEVGPDGAFQHKVVFKGDQGGIPVEAISADGSARSRTAFVLQPASI
jgi:hypothetical protein